jgi:hypothetical protein
MGKWHRKSGKDGNGSWASSLSLYSGDLTNDPKERPRQIYIFRVFRKWSFEQIARKLKLPQEKVIREFEAYTDQIVQPATLRSIEPEISFCEEQIRVLVRMMRDIFKLSRMGRITYTPEIVSLSKAIHQWEDLICKLRGHLLPSALLQELMEERKQALANLPQLSAEAQEDIYKVLRREKVSSDLVPTPRNRFGYG